MHTFLFQSYSLSLLPLPKKLWLGLTIILSCLIIGTMSVPASAAQNQKCQIMFSEGGRVSNYKESTSDIVWTPRFITYTEGPCYFRVYNEKNFKGRSAVYGTHLQKKVRAGARGRNDKGGWKVRSVEVIPFKTNMCRLILRDGGAEMSFYGPDAFAGITGWNFVSFASDRCEYKVFSGHNWKGKSKNIMHLTSAERRSEFHRKHFIHFEARPVRVGFRVRSIEINRRGKYPLK